jgi:GxxExxY protein
LVIGSHRDLTSLRGDSPQRHRGHRGSPRHCTHDIVGAAIEVHRRLGPGLLESAYETCLCRELYLPRIGFQQQVSLPVQYRGLELECGYRLDLVVEGSVIIEVKALGKMLPVHRAQVLTYLRLTGLRLGPIDQFQRRGAPKRHLPDH